MSGWSTWLYRGCFGLTACSAVIAVAFFVIGIADGTVSAFNIGLWAVLLAGLVAVLWGAHALRAAGRMRAAIALLALVAGPALLSGLFMLLLVVTQPRWN